MSIHMYTITRETILSVQKSLLLDNNFNNLHLKLGTRYMQLLIITKINNEINFIRRKRSFCSSDEI